MTEAEWLAAVDPVAMLEFLRGMVSNRKLRLVACACCRYFRHRLTDPRSQAVVRMSERFADGLCTYPDLRGVARAAAVAANQLHLRHRHSVVADDVREEIEVARLACQTAALNARDAAFHTLQRLTNREALKAGRTAGVPFLVDVVGNPFRPTAHDPAWLEWNDGAVVRLAQAIYRVRSFGRLPQLADCLEDAGCSDPDLLGHLRGPGPHVPGCHALDLLAGKS
jgi:hypothetical protein